MIRDSNSFSRGQTLLEIVITIAIVAILVTGLVGAATSSLRFSQESRERSSAVKYAQESIELVRNMRDSLSWPEFLEYSGSGSQSWCLNADNIWTLKGGMECDPIDTGSRFRRSLTFIWSDPLMHVVSTVSWNTAGQEFFTELQTHFTQW